MSITDTLKNDMFNISCNLSHNFLWQKLCEKLSGMNMPYNIFVAASTAWDTVEWSSTFHTAYCNKNIAKMFVSGGVLLWNVSYKKNVRQGSRKTAQSNTYIIILRCEATMIVKNMFSWDYILFVNIPCTWEYL